MIKRCVQARRDLDSELQNKVASLEQRLVTLEASPLRGVDGLDGEQGARGHRGERGMFGKDGRVGSRGPSGKLQTAQGYPNNALRMLIFTNLLSADGSPIGCVRAHKYAATGRDGRDGYCAVINGTTGEVQVPCPEQFNAANAQEVERLKGGSGLQGD